MSGKQEAVYTKAVETLGLQMRIPFPSPGLDAKAQENFWDGVMKCAEILRAHPKHAPLILGYAREQFQRQAMNAMELPCRDQYR